MSEKYQRVPTDDLNLDKKKSKLDIEDKKKPDTLFLYFNIATANLVAIYTGVACSWSSPVIPKLLSNDTDINPLASPITASETSIIVGLPNVCGVIGALLIPYTSDAFGRKKSLLIIAIIYFISTLVVSFSTNYIYMAIGRAIFSIGFGGTMNLMPVYISEICESHNRSKFGCLFSANIPIGSLYTFILGPKLGYKIFSMITAVPLIIFFFLFTFICETPLYLLSRGRKDECIISLKRLRKNKTSEEIKKDFGEFELALQAQKSVTQASILTVIKAKEGRVGLLLSFLATFLMLGCGMPTIQAFLSPVFNTFDTGISGDSTALICGMVQAICTLLVTGIVEKTKKRILLIMSSFCCGILLLILGICFNLNYKKPSLIENISWFPLVIIFVYFLIYSIGVGPITPVIPGELFSPKFIASGMVAVGLFSTLTAFLYATAFPLVESYAGVHWCFYIFAILSLSGSVLTIIAFPETASRSIVEVQDMLIKYKITFKNLLHSQKY